VSDSSKTGVVLGQSPDAPAAEAGGVHRRSFLGGLRRGLAALTILGALGGLLAWGHLTDWNVPKFSSLLGKSPGNDDWCSEHSVPESECVECNPSLLPRPKAYGWCKLHGVHECPLEHPEIAQTTTPALVSPEDLTRAQRALELTERTENSSRCKSHERRIQFVSQEAVEKAGIEVEPVWRAPVMEFVACSGETAYDATRTARLSPRVAGTAVQVFKDVGDPVREGEVVALVDAADVGKAKSEFLQALVHLRLKTDLFARLEEVYKQGATSERAYRDQAAAVSEARIRLTTAQQALTNLGLPVDLDSLKTVPQEALAERLRFLGLPHSLVSSLDPQTTTGNLLALVAPFDGVVLSRHIVRGEVVDPNKVLFVTADVRRLWLMLDLPHEEAKNVRLGQKVLFRPDGSTHQANGGITWLSTEADHKTRTVKARAVLENGDGRLRANVFGAGKIVLREETKAIVVPSMAVHWEGDCNVVFVRDRNFLKPGAAKVFHIRTVRPGARDEAQTEIIAGVLPGELVATRGSGILRAELLRGNLGEG
jgi:cobalt-zinc-cadmium efflux system membrane fusion protein